MLTFRTPGTVLSDFSTRITHDAQVMPVICSLVSEIAAVFMEASDAFSMVRIVKVLTMSRSMAASDSACWQSGNPIRLLDLATVGGLTVPNIDNPPELTMIAFEVNDMTCGHCVSTITKALKATDRDAKVQIDLATHRVQVEPVSADAEELAEAIKDAGYTPVSVEAGLSEAAAPGRGACCGHCK